MWWRRAAARTSLPAYRLRPRLLPVEAAVHQCVHGVGFARPPRPRRQRRLDGGEWPSRIARTDSSVYAVSIAAADGMTSALIDPSCTFRQKSRFRVTAPSILT